MSLSGREVVRLKPRFSGGVKALLLFREPPQPLCRAPDTWQCTRGMWCTMRVSPDSLGGLSMVQRWKVGLEKEIQEKWGIVQVERWLVSSHTVCYAGGRLCWAARDLEEVEEVNTVVRVIHLEREGRAAGTKREREKEGGKEGERKWETLSLHQIRLDTDTSIHFNIQKDHFMTGTQINFMDEMITPRCFSVILFCSSCSHYRAEQDDSAPHQVERVSHTHQAADS